MRALSIVTAASLIGAVQLGQTLVWNTIAPISYQRSVAKATKEDRSARGLFIKKSANAMLVRVLDAKTGAPVSPGKEFTTDDELSVVIEGNFESYAYIVNVETIEKTETRYLLYPTPLIANNKIRPDEPLKLRVGFDKTAATESLQVIVSHDRIEYLDAALNGNCSESENRCRLDARVAGLVASLVGNRAPSKASETPGVFPRQSDRKQNQSGLRSRDIILAPGKDNDRKETYVAIPIKQGSDGHLKSKQVIVFEVRLKHV